MSSKLSMVKESCDPLPPRITIYGPEKIGKSTFCADAPNPVALDIEGGFEFIKINRFSPDGLLEVFEFIDELLNEDHEFKTLAIDSADWLERLIQTTIAAEEGQNNISDVPYGAGYKKVAGAFSQLLEKLEELRQKKKMAIIFTAHANIKRFDDPVNESYDRYQLKLHDQVMALLQEWCDCILFATNKVYVSSKEKRFNKEVNKAKGGGERIVKTVGHPAYVAGNRLNLPDELPLSFAALQDAINNFYDNKGE